MIVYFKIFGKKLIKELPDDEYKYQTREQIEYYLRGQLKIDKIESEPIESKTPDIPDMLKDIFGGFTSAKR